VITSSTSELLKKEATLRRRLHTTSFILWAVGGLVLATLPWVTGVWSLINAGLLLILLGIGVWGYASVRYHGRSIDEAYRLGYDLGYEIGWHAKEFEGETNGDQRPLAPRKR
jgi:hypothetical protein